MAIENENQDTPISGMPNIGADLELAAVLPIVQEVEGGAKVNFQVSLTQVKETMNIPEFTPDQIIAIQNGAAPSEENPFLTGTGIGGVGVVNALNEAVNPSTDNPIATNEAVVTIVGGQQVINALQAASSPSETNPYATIENLPTTDQQNALNESLEPSTINPIMTNQAVINLIGGADVLDAILAGLDPTNDNPFITQSKLSINAQGVYSAATIDLKTVADTIIYTVPAGLKFIPTEVVLIPSNFNNVTVAPIISIGTVNGVFIDGAELVDFDDNSKIWRFVPSGLMKAISEGDEIKIFVNSNATANDMEVDVYLYGHQQPN